MNPPPLTNPSASREHNLATKRALIADARLLARSATAETDRKDMNKILIAWAHTGPAGLEHDGKLWWELKQACASFYERCAAKTAGNNLDTEPPQSGGQPTTRLRSAERLQVRPSAQGDIRCYAST
jgi:hypothetical protein